MSEALSTFCDDGVVVVRGAFEAEAPALREMVWRFIEAQTPVRLADPATWTFDGHLPLRALEERNIWYPVHQSSAVVEALDEVFGADADAWEAPSAPHLLLTFPRGLGWSIAKGQWHIDFGFDRPTWPTFAVKMFALLDTVEPGGGGTLLLKGSHRLVERAEQILGRAAEARDESLMFDSHPYLRKLHEGGAGRDLLDKPEEVHGVRVCPVEVTGEPGDVFLTHMQVFHSPSPNTAERPRLMIGSTFSAASG